ncbi:MAG: CoA transferase [Acidiferrobacterales bacterium]|nr:CoA transferase [Acidiferrobacterales bacterium]
MSAPLSGIKVIDLSQYAPGPYTSKLLHELGAEVLKIEPPQGDPLRQMFGGDKATISPVYLTLNEGKFISKINLKKPLEQKRVLEQIALADVMIESFRPGIVKKLGLDQATCYRINPSLVYASLSGYGQDGPYSDKAGHDINYAAAAGLLSSVKLGSPMFPLIADHVGAMNAVNLILASLVSKQTTGKGCYLDISLYEPMLSWQYFNQSVAVDQKNSLQLLTGGAACYQIYRTCDERYVTLGALESHFWRNFCEAVGRPEWGERQFEAIPQRQLIADVSKLIGSKPIKHWEEVLGAVDCCFEPIPLENEVYSHPQTCSRKIFSQTHHGFPGKRDGQNLAGTGPLIELEPGEFPEW